MIPEFPGSPPVAYLLFGNVWADIDPIIAELPRLILIGAFLDVLLIIAFVVRRRRNRKDLAVSRQSPFAYNAARDGGKFGE